MLLDTPDSLVQLGVFPHYQVLATELPSLSSTYFSLLGLLVS